jgi:hypothetical protein
MIKKKRPYNIKHVAALHSQHQNAGWLITEKEIYNRLKMAMVLPPTPMHAYIHNRKRWTKRDKNYISKL